MARYLLLLFSLIAAALAAALGVVNGRDAIAAAHREMDRQLARAGKALASAEEDRFQDLLAVAARAAGFEPLRTALGERVARGEPPDQATLDAAGGALAVDVEPGATDRSTLLVVVSERGFADSRLGETSRFGDGPRTVVAGEALGGRRAHGFSVIDDRLYRVVAVPVGPGEKPLGALVLGFPVDEPFAAALKEAAGADVSILRGGKVVASTLPPSERSQVAAAAGPAGMLPFGFGQPPPGAASILGVVPAPFLLHGARGQRASAEPLPGVEGAVVVLSLDALAAIGPAAAQGERALLLAAALLIAGIALFAVARGPSGDAVGRLADAAEALAAGTLQPAPEGLGGDLGRIARALGHLGPAAAPEVFLPAPRAEGEAPPPAAPEPTPSFARVPEATTSSPTDPFGGLGRPPLEKTVIAPATPEPASTSGADWPAALSGAPAPARDAPPIPGGFDPFASFPPVGQTAGSDRTMTSADPTMVVPQEQTVVAAVPTALLRATSRAPEVDPEEAHHQEVFREFLEVRRRCGEAVEGVTFEKFAAKLRKNREQLVEKYRCRTVRFTVYVKDGKTALKATPVKE